MPDRPQRSHYNQDDSIDLDLPLAMNTAEARSVDALRDTTGTIFGTWAVRVAVMAVALWLVNYLLGPFGWTWWALLAYAVISLGASLALNRLKNRQLDRIGQLYEQEQARRF